MLFCRKCKGSLVEYTVWYYTASGKPYPSWWTTVCPLPTRGEGRGRISLFPCSDKWADLSTCGR